MLCINKEVKYCNSNCNTVYTLYILISLKQSTIDKYEIWIDTLGDKAILLGMLLLLGFGFCPFFIYFYFLHLINPKTTQILMRMFFRNYSWLMKWERKNLQSKLTQCCESFSLANKRLNFMGSLVMNFGTLV